MAELPALELTISDISPKCIELAQTKITGRWPQVNFYVANCTELKYPDLSFDCVFGCSILHHLPLQPVLREIHRVLRPGGILWFSEPNMLNPQIAAQKHIRFIGKWLDDTEDETAYFRWPMARELVSAGFSNILVQPFDFLHPGTPRTVVRIVDLLANAAERVPLLREIAGSLVIQATKPR